MKLWLNGRRAPSFFSGRQIEELAKLILSYLLSFSSKAWGNWSSCFCWMSTNKKTTLKIILVYVWSVAKEEILWRPSRLSQHKHYQLLQGRNGMKNREKYIRKSNSGLKKWERTSGLQTTQVHCYIILILSLGRKLGGCEHISAKLHNKK